MFELLAFFQSVSLLKSVLMKKNTSKFIPRYKQLCFEHICVILFIYFGDYFFWSHHFRSVQYSVTLICHSATNSDSEFVINVFTYWADFYYFSQLGWASDWLYISLSVNEFCQNYGLWTVKISSPKYGWKLFWQYIFTFYDTDLWKLTE